MSEPGTFDLSRVNLESMPDSLGEASQEFVNPLDDENQLRRSHALARQTDPATAAQDSIVADKSGQPVRLVRDQRKFVEDEQEFQEIRELMDNAPALRDFIRNPENMAQARGDARNLSLWETAVNAWERGGLIDSAGQLGYRQLMQYSDETAAQLEKVNRHISARPVVEDGFASWIDAASEVGGQMVTAFLDENVQNTALTGMAGGMTVAGIAGQLGPQAFTPEEIVTIPAGGITGYSTGLAVGMAEHAYKVEAGHVYNEMMEIRDENGNAIDPEVAQAAAHTVGVINAALEVVGIKYVSAPFRKTLKNMTKQSVMEALKTPTMRRALIGLGRNYAEAWGGEVSTEVMQEIVSMTATEMASQFSAEGELSVGELLETMTQEEYQERLFDIFEKVGKGMALLAIPGASISFAQDARAAQQTIHDQQKLAELAGISEQSELRQLNPDAYARLVREQARRAGTETIYIEPEAAQRFLQSDKNDTLNDDGTPQQWQLDLESQIPDAIEGGDYVSVPIEAWATDMVGTQLEESLRPHMKVTTDSFTPNERFESEMEERVQEIRDNAEASMDADNQVFSEVYDQLVAAGVSPSVAEDKAIWWEAFFSTRAKSAYSRANNLTAKDWFDRYFGGITREADPAVQAKFREVEHLDTVLDRIRKGDLPTEITPEERALDEAQQALEAESAEVAEIQKLVEAGEDIDDVQADKLQIWPERESRLNKTIEDAQVSGNVPPPEMQSLRADFDVIQDILDLNRVDIQSLSNQEIKDRILGKRENVMFADGELDPRGYFDPESMGIAFTKRANLSTFLHESGHYFLEVYRDMAQFDPEVAADMEALLKHFGLESADQIGTNQHEEFASMMEAWLMEGKAPTKELQPIFSRFRQWLAMIYKKSSEIYRRNDLPEIELSNEVRQVLGRMFASQQEIDAAEQEMHYGPLPIEEMSDNPEVQQKYLSLLNEAQDEAEAQMLERVVADLRRETQRWWKEERAKHEAQVVEELAQDRTYIARDTLSGDTPPPAEMDNVKLNSGFLKEAYGVATQKKLHRMSAKTGRHPDEMAQLFGYLTGDELVTDMLSSMNKQERKEYARAEAERRMKAEHGDILNDNTLPAHAKDVVHNEKQAEKLVLELKLLNEKTGNQFAMRGISRVTRAIYREAAARDLAELTLRQVKPHHYLTNEQKYGRMSYQNALKGDWNAAREAKHKQLRNFYKYREALRIQKQAESHRKRLAQMQKTRYSKRVVDPDYTQQLKVLLAAYDMRKSPRAVNQALNSVNNFISSQQKSNPDLIAHTILNSIQDWRDMTIQDLKAVRDAAENLLDGGKKFSEQTREQRKAQAQEIVDHTYASIDKPKKKRNPRGGFGRLLGGIDQFSAYHSDLELLLFEADGGVENGPLQRLVFRMLWDAQVTEVERGKLEHENMKNMFEGFEYLFNGFKDNLLDASEEAGITHAGKYVDTHEMVVNRGKDNQRIISLNRSERLVLLLNYGNEGNREALRNQSEMAMEDADILAAIGTLNKEELELANRIWAYVDSFYTELAATEKNATGVAPAKVEGTTFEVNGVHMTGGYYPLQANTALDWRSEMHEVEARAEKLRQEGGAVRASTKHGSTIERTSFAGQNVNLQIDGLFKHVDGILHDITHREAVMEADIILRNKDVRQAITDAIGKDGYSAINKSITRLAGGNTHPSDLAVLNKLMRFSRIAVGYGAMGYSVRTGLINITGLFPAIPEVGKAPLAASMTKQFRNPINFGKEIKARSSFMQERSETIMRDVYATLRDMKTNSTWNSFKQNAFWIIVKMDAFVSRSVWYAAYQNALNTGMSEKDAVFAADRTVVRTQGTGMKIDLSAVEDHNEIIRAMTPMYTYFNTILNLQKRQNIKAKHGHISRAKWLEGMFWIYFVPAMLEEFMFGTPDDEREDDRASRYGKAVASYVAGQWFFIRDLSGLVRYGQTFDSPLVSTGAAPVKFLIEAFDLMQDDTEIDKSTITATANLLPVIGIPTGAQVNRMSRHLLEMEDSGEDFSPYKFLVTGREDDTDFEKLILGE